MKLISIKFRNNVTYYLKVLFLILFSFFISYYYGFKGIIPLDDFVNLKENDLIINDGLRQVEDGQIVKVISTKI